MKLESLQDVLVTAGLGVEGFDLFLSMMPASAESGILLRQPYGGIRIHHDLPGYFKGQIVLIVRGQNYTATETRMNNAVAALTCSNTQLGTYFFKYIRPYAQPVPFPLSEGGLVEFNCFMDVCFNE